MFFILKDRYLEDVERDRSIPKHPKTGCERGKSRTLLMSKMKSFFNENKRNCFFIGRMEREFYKERRCQ